MANAEASISWYEQRLGKVSYSMGARLGPNAYDCSSALYFSLIAGGFLAVGTMGNTDTLFGTLEGIGWSQTSNPKRGDVFIFGQRGASGGSAGHTGLFIDQTNVIHCTSGSNGISVNTYQSVYSGAGSPPVTIYANPDTLSNAPVLNTEAEKRAYAFAQLMSSKGYNTISIASMLGSAVAEVGDDLNPDTEQNSGPAYGLFQWDGSAYPLTGPKTSNGRQYVQTLMAKAGITGDYTSVEMQAELTDWCMSNGQWIGAVSPLTVEEFKTVSDITDGTMAFLKNFERAGVDRFDVRLNGAKKWLAFLEGLPSGYENFPRYETLTNVGALDYLGISNGLITAEGWHFSSDKAIEYIAFINAETDEEIGRVQAEHISREDVKTTFPNVLGIDQSGFNVSFAVPNGTAVYIKGIRTNGTTDDELIFDKIIIFEQAFDRNVDEFASGNESFFFEIIENNKVIARGKTILNDLEWSNELMFVPTTSIVLPISFSDVINGREELKLYINQKVFHGIVSHFELNKVEETMTVELTHIVSEWEYRQVSTNLACKNRTVNDIFSTLDFRYPGWNVEYMQDAANRVIDYVYSRQNKLEALTKTCNLTEDLFWRVGFNFGRKLDIGTFGDKKPYILSKRPSGKSNIKILNEPTISHEFEEAFNILTVYGEKSDSGMSSVSLRDVYEEKDSFIEGFPVVILRKGINNERDYDYINFTKLAPNNSLEYSILNEKGIALESGRAIERSQTYNDLAPFNVQGETIQDEDRAKVARTVYEAAVKLLKLNERRLSIILDTERIPADLVVGDRIRFLYDNFVQEIQECSNYQRKIMLEDDWYYVTTIDYHFDKSGGEYNTLTLQKQIVSERSE